MNARIVKSMFLWLACRLKEGTTMTIARVAKQLEVDRWIYVSNLLTKSKKCE